MIDYKETRELLRKAMFGTYNPKTMKQVFVHNANGKDYYRMQLVNTDQVNQALRGTSKVEQPDTKKEKPGTKNVATQPVKPVISSKGKPIASPKIKYKSGFIPNEIQKKNIDTAVSSVTELVSNLKSSLKQSLETYKKSIESEAKLYYKDNWKQAYDNGVTAMTKLLDNLQISKFKVNSCNDTKINFSFDTNIPSRGLNREFEDTTLSSYKLTNFLMSSIENAYKGDNSKFSIDDRDSDVESYKITINHTKKENPFKSAIIPTVKEKRKTPVSMEEICKTVGINAKDPESEGLVKRLRENYLDSLEKANEGYKKLQGTGILECKTLDELYDKLDKDKEMIDMLDFSDFNPLDSVLTLAKKKVSEGRLEGEELDQLYYTSAGQLRESDLVDIYHLSSFIDNLSVFENFNKVEKSDYTENKDIKCSVSNVTGKEYQDVYDKVVKDFQVGEVKDGYFQRENITYKIKGIYKIEGLAIEKDFNNLVKKNVKYKDKNYGGKNGHIDYFYHGTPTVSAIKILGDSGQFVIPETPANGSMLGAGVYITDASSKSVAYMAGTNPYTSTYRGALLMCKASLGNCLYGTNSEVQSKNDLWSEYDSLGVEKEPDGALAHNEWKTNSDKAVIPNYYIEVEVNGKVDE